MHVYTVRVYDRAAGKTAHDAILVKGIHAEDEADAVDRALRCYNPLAGEALYAERIL